MAENIVCSLFPYEGEPTQEVDGRLDTVVTDVASDILNDIPVGDPRWASIRSSEVSLAGSSSLLILNQLEDKQRSLELFFSFLKEVKIWDRVRSMLIFLWSF